MDAKLHEEIKNENLDAVIQLITDIYEQRKEGLATGGEYSLQNLIFKEFRNRGYLDNLKELKDYIIGQELSLESLEEDTKKTKDGKWVNQGEAGVHGKFNTKKEADAQRKAMFANGFSEDLDTRLTPMQLRKYREELSRIAHNQAVVQDNGLFHIYQVKEIDLNGIINQMYRLDYIDWIQKSAGQFDFSQPPFPGQLPKRYYTITGKIK